MKRADNLQADGGKRKRHLALVSGQELPPDPIDVSRLIDQMEAELREGTATARARQTVALLQSWAWNDRILLGCQQRARRLLREFRHEH